MKQAHIGIIGLGVMGGSLARNIAGKGYTVSVYNRTTQRTNTFLKTFGNKNLLGHKTLKNFILSLERPRKVILMVQAGSAVDAILKELTPLMGSGDIIVDCGNSLYTDTIRRESLLQKQEIRFFGCGISGGEEGALNGPSLMPGGNRAAWRHLKPIFEAVAAKDFTGNPCVTYVGENGAGHFVKMVHNGIEYAVMQMLAESYEILSRGYRMSPYEIAAIFKKYNEGRLQ
ncbi:NAD(P)-binding domain-containing protein, partial [Candidatus Gracilibacteria bacterium]|nr:NAD(P)-binding domain-containing protein [Candidatus Gracilibacteria bacterium]